MTARIVVGVDNSDAALAAVRYAAAEARRTGAALDLVHAAPELGPLGTAIARAQPLSPEQHRAIGDRLLNRARKVARELTGDHWIIRTDVRPGPAARALAAEAKDARVVVVGHQHRTAAEHLLVGSVVARLAGQATVPIVVVPETWTPAEPARVVVVGVTEGDESQALLRVALATAAHRGARLRVVHAWDLPEGYDELIAVPRDGEVWTSASVEQLGAALRRVRPDHPHVPVELELTHGEPADVLRAAADGADLLLVGVYVRHAGLERLGHTVRALLRDTRCPVALVPTGSEAALRGESPVLDPELVD